LRAVLVVIVVFDSEKGSGFENEIPESDFEWRD
jgi:hypothetical protein